jgi:GNAT superfamily N-acetyltransferase
MVTYRWRGRFDNSEVSKLHSDAFGQPSGTHDWWEQVSQHSLGWVCGRDRGSLVGFVNVPWDGASHAFVVDTIVAPKVQRHGVGTGLVAVAVREARTAGCDWIHVDFEDHLRGFYFDSCGFRATSAGLIDLTTGR